MRNAPANLFVSETGSDDADGFKHPLASLQAAFDLAYSFIGDVRIHVADGYYPGTNATARGARQGRIEIIGNVEHPEQVRLDAGIDTLSMSTIWAVEGASLSVRGLHISATHDTDAYQSTCVRATFHGIVFIDGPMIFWRAGYAHFVVAGNSSIIVNRGYAVEGGARYHVLSSTGGIFVTVTNPAEKIVLTNRMHYSVAFAATQTNGLINWRLPIEGSVTGRKHILRGGRIEMRSIEEFPGDLPGENISGFYKGKVYGTPG